MDSKHLELIPNVGTISKPFFNTRADYENFRESFCKEIKPELDRQREARRLSEEESRKHFIN